MDHEGKIVGRPFSTRITVPKETLEALVKEAADEKEKIVLSFGKKCYLCGGPCRSSTESGVPACEACKAGLVPAI